MSEPSPPTQVEVKALLAVSRNSIGIVLMSAYPHPSLNESMQFVDAPNRDFVAVDRVLWIALLEALAEKL